MFSNLNPIGGKILLNFLAFSAEEGKRLQEITENAALLGITAADNDFHDGVAQIRTLKEIAGVVSVALGGGGAADMWEKALNLAAATEAGHLNQPFTTAGYANGVLGGRQVVNALIRPLMDGKVNIATGPASSTTVAEVSPETAALLARDAGIRSIKIISMKDFPELAQLTATVRGLAVGGIKTIEVAGGINLDNIAQIVRCCLDGGAQLVIPHVFGFVSDLKKRTTDFSKVKILYDTLIREFR